MRERRQCDSNPSARAYRRRKRRHASRWAQAGAPAALEQLEAKLLLADTSFPVIFQWFDGSYNTIEERAAGIIAAGYGSN